MKEKQHLRAVFLYMGWPEPCRPQATGEAGSWNFVSDGEQNIPDHK